jgi:hypothetical protein
MRQPIEIEDIEQLRREQGIEDVELREEIRTLGIGDHVRVTLLNSAVTSRGETVVVRITSIKGPTFRGKLATQPMSAALARFRAGFPIVFTASHIHSLAKAGKT